MITRMWLNEAIRVDLHTRQSQFDRDVHDSGHGIISPIRRQQRVAAWHSLASGRVRDFVLGQAASRGLRQLARGSKMNEPGKNATRWQKAKHTIHGLVKRAAEYLPHATAAAQLIGAYRYFRKP